jgi:alpha,alpha-trehalose phosphorylase
MDLGDVGGNVRDGCHVASMGGIWMTVAYGLAGLRDRDGRIAFRPRQLQSGVARFPLTIREQMLELQITTDSVTYRLKDGDSLTFHHTDEEIRLTQEDPIAVRPLK